MEGATPKNGVFGNPGGLILGKIEFQMKKHGHTKRVSKTTDNRAIQKRFYLLFVRSQPLNHVPLSIIYRALQEDGGGDPTVAEGTVGYSETGFITPVNSLGVFSYELGSGTPASAPLDVSAYTGPEPIYALLVVGGSPLLPKLRVTPVPRSHVAA